MAINGYTDRLSVQPGETIKFMVHSENENYETQITRLISGDTDPEGPGFKAEKIDADVNKTYKGKVQEIHMGSYVKIADNIKFQDTNSFSLQAMIFPTTPEKGAQGLLTKWSDSENSGYGLFIDDDGSLAVWIGDKNGNVEKIRTEKPLMSGCWFFVGASFDAESGKVTVFQEAVISRTNGRFSNRYDTKNVNETVEKTIKIKPNVDNGVPFVIASVLETKSNNKDAPIYQYNGKIDRPRLANTAIDKDKMTDWIENPAGLALVAAWDFSAEITKNGIKNITHIYDVSANKFHGTAINTPQRASTGYNWTSKEHNFIHAPEQYGAIHFHDDDLTDADWDVDFEWKVPDTLKSGIYAARVYADNEDEQDYIVFFVRPKRGVKPTAKIVFIAPTASYLAYANNRFQDVPSAQLMFGRAPVVQADDRFLGKHAEYGLSMYDHHNDESGVAFSSSLRPILNMRPKYRHNLSPSLWQFNADLHLIDWLTEKGYDFDVITDHDLHQDGVELLDQYNVALTGTHPEYYSGEMLDAVEDFQENGGRFMYMGGNAFIWVVQFHPDNPSIMEVRKNWGNTSWKALPGEVHLSFTGELGSLWKHRNRAPQKIGGTGYVGQGFEISSYYRRTDDSFNSNVSWVFEGVTDEKIGDFGLVGGGAAGMELDIYDTNHGTPPHALILASSEDHSSVYVPVTEELYFNTPGLSGDEHPRIRADMVYYPTPNDGAVFSVSSISYCGSLSHNDYNNNISQITENVLTRFMSDEPLNE